MWQGVPQFNYSLGEGTLISSPIPSWTFTVSPLLFQSSQGVLQPEILFSSSLVLPFRFGTSTQNISYFFQVPPLRPPFSLKQLASPYSPCTVASPSLYKNKAKQKMAHYLILHPAFPCYACFSIVGSLGIRTCLPVFCKVIESSSNNIDHCVKLEWQLEPERFCKPAAC